MRKIAYLFTALFAVCSLAGCGSDKGYTVNPEITGGSADEKTAILEAINKKPIAVNKNGDTIKPLSTLSDKSKMDRLLEDDGDYVKLTTQQLVKVNDEKYTVKIEWNVDTTSEYYASFQQSPEDAYHKILELKYKGWGAPDGEIDWEVKSMTCGGAAVAKPSELKYGAAVVNQIYFYDDTTIADFNAVTDAPKVVNAGGTTYTFPSTFDKVDYEYHDYTKYSPYFRVHKNNREGRKDDGKPIEGAYYFCNIPGKVLYCSPDGNWALINDGNNILELYAGSALDLKTSEYPNLVVGQNVIATGNASVYQGNIQLGFITKISKLEETGKIDETPVEFTALTGTEIAGWKDATLKYDKQAVAGLSNSLRKATGTVVAGSLKDRDGNAVTDPDKLPNNRFTFELLVEGEKVQVAYDYHTDRNGTVGLFNQLKSALKSGKALTVSGTMRYNNNREKDTPFMAPEVTGDNKPIWNIVPFLTEHVVING